MATIPVGFGQCTIRFRLIGGTRDALTTFAYDAGALDPAAHAFYFHQQLTAAGRPCVPSNMSNVWSYTGVVVTEMDDTGPLTSAFEASTVGGASIATPPVNSSVLIRKRTLAGGRRNRGRMFIPPFQINEGGVDAAGLMQNAQRDAVNATWVLGFFPAITTAGFPQVILHSEAPFTPTPVSSYEVQSLMATQRRRMRK